MAAHRDPRTPPLPPPMVKRSKSYLPIQAVRVCLPEAKYPKTRCLGFWVLGILVQLLDKYMIIKYLDH